MTVLPGLDLVAPMLAAAGTPPAGGGWAYEMKFDGVWAIAYLQSKARNLGAQY